MEADVLLPVAARGLVPDAMGRRFELSEHPRLGIISSAQGPVLFPRDSDLPDPFDGLVAADRTALHRVHACLGCPLDVEGQRIGVLTADALHPEAFDHLDMKLLGELGALAGAAMHTTQLIEALEEAASRQGLIAHEMMRDVRERQGGELIGASPKITRLREEVALIAPSTFTVLITGETGVGKEVVAHAIHAASPRRDRPLTYVNCAALPASLAESELFGHARGAFTGAATDRHGKFDVADGGTLLLDEIGELPLELQPKLLRVLQSGEIQRVGVARTTRVDVRLLAATNRDLQQEVREGRFRADLYHRLHVYPLRVPSLRERPEDIPLFAGYFLERIRRRLGLAAVRLEPDTLDALERYSWPGNVRELDNVLSRAVLQAAAGVRRNAPVLVTPAVLHLEPATSTEAPVVPVISRGTAKPLREAVDEFRRASILRAVRACDGNWSAAARELGMDRSNLHHLARRLGLEVAK
jgi:anaerobic nitric oxide reductase transcription regulator